VKTFNFIALTMLLLIVAVGCRTKKEVTLTTTNTPNQTEHSINQFGEPCVDPIHDVIWTPIDKKKSNMDMVDLAVFMTDQKRLRDVMIAGFENGQSFNIAIPLYINGQVECLTFELQDSGTLNHEQQKKNGVLTFKGFELNNGGNTARVDYYFEKGLRVYANIGENRIFLEPLPNQKMIYISFDKNASSSLKEQFEIND